MDTQPPDQCLIPRPSVYWGYGNETS